MKANKDKNSGFATGNRGIVVNASAIENPGTWVRILASVSDCDWISTLHKALMVHQSSLFTDQHVQK